MLWIAIAVVGLALAGIIGWYVAATRVETPDYRVERTDGSIEIRHYPALIARPRSRAMAHDRWRCAPVSRRLRATSLPATAAARRLP